MTAMPTAWMKSPATTRERSPKRVESRPRAKPWVKIIHSPIQPNTRPAAAESAPKRSARNSVNIDSSAAKAAKRWKKR